MKRLGEIVNLPARAASAVPAPIIKLPVTVQEARSTADVDRALLRSLPPSVKAGLRHRCCFQTFEFIGFEVVNPIEPSEAREVLGWLAAIDHRPSQAEAVKEITRCLSVTAARAKDSADLKMMLGVMAEELSEFPADVVRESLRDWSRTEKWWPTLSEIRERCLKATRVQSGLKSALELALLKGGAA
jgi:hypothetical protein